MAQVSIVRKVSMLAVVVALAATTVSAQAPAPSPDAVGAAFSIPTSGVMIGSSLLLSFVALFRN